MPTAGQLSTHGVARATIGNGCSPDRTIRLLSANVLQRARMQGQDSVQFGCRRLRSIRGRSGENAQQYHGENRNSVHEGEKGQMHVVFRFVLP